MKYYTHEEFKKTAAQVEEDYDKVLNLLAALLDKTNATEDEIKDINRLQAAIRNWEMRSEAKRAKR